MTKFRHRKLFATSKSRWVFSTSKAWSFLAMATIVSFLTFFVAVPASADNVGDVEKGLATQGYYVSTVAKQNLPNEKQQESILSQTVSQLKQKKHPGGLVIIDANTLSSLGYSDAQTFAEYLRNYISNPKLDEVIVAVGGLNSGSKGSVGLSATKISTQQAQTLVNNSLSTFTTKSFADGIQQVALAAANNISSDNSSQTLLIVGIVVVVILLIVGGVAYLLISTKNNWKKQLQSLQDLNNRVSDLVVRVSEGIDYLPDGQRDQVRNAFGQATAQMSDAQANMRSLESASAIQLTFSGGKFRQQMNNTGSELQNSYNTLQQLERGIEKV